MRSALIYVLETEQASGEALSLPLRRAGFNVVSLPNDQVTREAFDRQLPDLLIIDACSSFPDELTLTEWLHAQSDIQLLVILKQTQFGIASELKLKIEQFLIAPVQDKELLDRVNFMLNRSARGPVTILEFSGLKIDFLTRSVTLHGEVVRLTIKEFELLWLLARHPDRVFTRDQLLNTVWGHVEFIDPETVTVHIHRLRSKIEADLSNPLFVQTVHGKGYKFGI